jgi:hypothetical protein
VRAFGADVIITSRRSDAIRITAVGRQAVLAALRQANAFLDPNEGKAIMFKQARQRMSDNRFLLVTSKTVAA